MSCGWKCGNGGVESSLRCHVWPLEAVDQMYHAGLRQGALMEVFRIILAESKT